MSGLHFLLCVNQHVARDSNIAPRRVLLQTVENMKRRRRRLRWHVEAGLHSLET